MSLPQNYRRILREDLATFVRRAIRQIQPNLELEWNWHHDLIIDRLTKLASGEIKRLLICVPPRSLKSLICSVAFPAWVLGLRPSDAVLCISYAQPLADTFSRQTRQVMESSFYTSAFKTRVSREKRAVELFETTDGGMRIATSVGGTLTGRGGDLIILDDLMKPDDAASEAGRRSTLEWMRNTLASRPNSKRDIRMLCVMQRLHEEDVAAEFIEQGGWEILTLPAIAIDDEVHRYQTLLGAQQKHRRAGEALHPEREPIEILDDLRRRMGSLVFEAQYQQQPVPLEGNIFRRSWIQAYGPAEVYSLDRVIQSWDTAGKTAQHNDYSVCTTWGLKGHRAYLLDVFRQKLEFPDLKRMVVELADRFGAERVIIEEQISGLALVQELRSVGFYKVFPHKPKTSKLERFLGVTPMFESGQVLLPDRAAWLEAYLQELCAFPRGKHDDQVDSTSQALEWVRDVGAEPGLIGFYRLEAERQRASQEDRTVRLMPPQPTSTVYLLDGSVAWPDLNGTFLVTPVNAAPLRLAGFTEVPPAC